VGYPCAVRYTFASLSISGLVLLRTWENVRVELGISLPVSTLVQRLGREIVVGRFQRQALGARSSRKLLGLVQECMSHSLVPGRGQYKQIVEDPQPLHGHG
jgi:hypothetical protein